MVLAFNWGSDEFLASFSSLTDIGSLIHHTALAYSYVLYIKDQRTYAQKYQRNLH